MEKNSKKEIKKLQLLPLPPRPFEFATWKIATVAPNYHISIENKLLCSIRIHQAKCGYPYYMFDDRGVF